MPALDRATARRWTAREVRQLIAESPLATPRYELVDGELLVTPSPSWPHQRAVQILVRELSTYLLGEPVGHVGQSPFDVEPEPELIVQPDVFVLPIVESQRLLHEMPARALLLAVEILSPSSSRHDRVRKRPAYQRHVPEYWIVDLDARLIERWMPGDDRPALITETLAWLPPGASMPFHLDLPRYFAEIFLER
ncbi:MAG TPA: Uma2 family endonuclease [Gemmatimonadaceae bacterium]|nr:Uma2 family endonuclease [Gemmatimonadaceae bacterium]